MNKTRNIKKRKIKKTQRKYNDVTTHGARKTKQNQIVKKRKISKTKRMHKSRSNQFGGDNDDWEGHHNFVKPGNMQQYIGDTDDWKDAYTAYTAFVKPDNMKQYIGDDGKYGYTAVIDSDRYQKLNETSKRLVLNFMDERNDEVDEMEQKQREQEECKIAVTEDVQKSYQRTFEKLIKQMDAAIATATKKKCSQ